jgi:hypothetical protein
LNYDGNAGGYPSGVTVYAPGANGNAAPLGSIPSGTCTGMSLLIDGLAVDAIGRIYVGDRLNNRVLVYAPGASGAIAPIETLTGSNTGLSEPGTISLDAAGHIWVANAGGNDVLEFPAFAAGTQNVAPIGTISGNGTGFFGQLACLTIGPGSVIYTCISGNEYAVEQFPAGTNSTNATPSATLGGSNTGLSHPDGIAFDSGGNMYVVSETSGASGTLEVFTSTSGNIAPSETYSPGSFGPALNAAGDIAVVGALNGAASSIVIYPPFVSGASGVLPIATIQGSNTGLYDPIAVVYH